MTKSFSGRETPQIIVYSQYYRCRDPERQREIDSCLALNLNHPGVSRVVLYVEPGAPEPPAGRNPLELLIHPGRITYADWLRQATKETGAIALLLNADIHLDEGLEQLPASFANLNTFIALSRYNPGAPGEPASLNDFPHWTQDCWGIHSDATIPEGLLHASGFPLGFPGCDNRIAHVMWSHGFMVKNPSYHVRTIHLHATTSRNYNKTNDRLYGGVTYVHPSLAPAEPSELEHALWSLAPRSIPGLVVNRQGSGGGIESLPHQDPLEAEPFHHQQRFTGLSWTQHALGSALARPILNSATASSQDTIFLPLAESLERWITIRMTRPAALIEASVRLPQCSGPGFSLALRARDAAGAGWSLLAQSEAPLTGGGARNFLVLQADPDQIPSELQVRLFAPAGDPHSWQPSDGWELVLFDDGAAAPESKSLRRIAEPAPAGEPAPSPPPSEPVAALGWRQRSQVALDRTQTHLQFNRRFRVLRMTESDAASRGEQLLFEDAYGPWLAVTPTAQLPVDASDPLALFLWGFCQPRLELRPELVQASRRHGKHSLYWWSGSRTEERAWQRHGLLPGPQRQGDKLHLYLGLPWATFLETGIVPQVLLQAHRSRVDAIREVLAGFGLMLEVHSVCQHPRWQERPELFEQAGISTLWLSHRSPGLHNLGELSLKSWHLTPFGGDDPSARRLLALRDPEQRPFLASFLGEAPGLENGQRQQLADLHHQHRWHLQLGPDWPEEASRSGDAWERHDRLLCDSVFCLCPAGAGPNREHLWDALAVGTIPVLIGEELALPSGIDWSSILLNHPADQLDSLPERLAGMSAEEISHRSQQALIAHQIMQQTTCFGAVEEPPAPAIQRGAEQNQTRPEVVVPLYGPEDRYFWRARKCAFYDIALEWYFRGYINLKFSRNNYFWWGQEGSILLFERDLIINLMDGKRNPPRWPGEICYEHAFFANQYHLSSPRNHKMTYWGYAPCLLEKGRLHGRKGWQDRTINTFFAGTVENETQEFFRRKFEGWDAVIDAYACADKLNKQEKAVYSLNDYIDHLSRSRFSIAFHGNGPKCYREMESMAVGTPMIITEGLEVDYPEPLQEGVHYFVATTPQDILRIVNDTGPEAWELMSKACWDWFERNGSIDRLFQSLSTAISGLGPRPDRHRQVRICADPISGRQSLAAQSLSLIDPEAEALFEGDGEECSLQLRPDAMVIGKLPEIGSEQKTKWFVNASDLRAYCQQIAESSHPAHKKLLTLVGVRLPNFKVRIESPQGEINPFDRLERGMISLRSSDETAILDADFDWSRRCSMKYINVTRRLRGPLRLRQTLITAILRYRCEGQERYSDLSDHFNDWYVIHERLISQQDLYVALKLWEFEDCELLTIRGQVHRDGEPEDFVYQLGAV